MYRISAALKKGDAKMDEQFVTTAWELAGYHIIRSLGIVQGITVRLFGDETTYYTLMCEQARQDAYNLMIRHAQKLNANAIIGMHYDSTEIAPGITEIVCYGTAVEICPYDCFG